jgi:hypothetical protein
MPAWTLYHAVTGEVLRVNSTVGTEPPLGALKPNEVWAIGDYPSRGWYFDNEVPLAREPNPVVADNNNIPADGVAVLTITGIPDASGVVLHGPGFSQILEQAHIGGEPVEITVDTPGDYQVFVRSWPTLDGVINFVAV